METPKIELVCDSSEPGLNDFRVRLKTAMTECGLPAHWKECYDTESGKAAFLLNVNDKIAWTSGKQNITDLEVADIKNLIMQQPSRRFSWKTALKTHLSFITAVLIAFFPKCPFCWAAYMSVLSSIGLSGISYQPWLLPVLIAVMFVNIISLYMSGKRHGYQPLYLALAGAFVITMNRLFWEQQACMIIGALLLITASLWNTLSKRMAFSVRKYIFR